MGVYVVDGGHGQGSEVMRHNSCDGMTVNYPLCVHGMDGGAVPYPPLGYVI